jgi:hypothetical protein
MLDDSIRNHGNWQTTGIYCLLPTIVETVGPPRTLNKLRQHQLFSSLQVPMLLELLLLLVLLAWMLGNTHSTRIAFAMWGFSQPNFSGQAVTIGDLPNSDDESKLWHSASVWTLRLSTGQSLTAEISGSENCLQGRAGGMRSIGSKCQPLANASLSSTAFRSWVGRVK